MVYHLLGAMQREAPALYAKLSSIRAVGTDEIAVTDRRSSSPGDDERHARASGGHRPRRARPRSPPAARRRNRSPIPRPSDRQTAMNTDRLVAGLDIGSAKTTAIIAEVVGDRAGQHHDQGARRRSGAHHRDAARRRLRHRGDDALHPEGAAGRRADGGRDDHRGVHRHRGRARAGDDVEGHRRRQQRRDHQVATWTGRTRWRARRRSRRIASCCTRSRRSTRSTRTPASAIRSA